MNHFSFRPTPIDRLDYLSERLGVNFFLKREDLFGIAGGGSKARMLQYILQKAKNENADYIITAGGPFSNFNRVLALMAQKSGMKVRLILYDKNTHLDRVSLNKRVCDLAGVEYVTCDPEEVAEILKLEIEKLKSSGNSPFFIWGGGQSVEGSFAYFDAVKEIKEFNQVVPDILATALGTGTTFSGLYLGGKTYFPDCLTLGISIARTKTQATPIVKQTISNLAKYLELKNQEDHPADQIVDDFLFGGYGKTSPECKEFIQNTSLKEAILFDDIYVGKALFGLCKIIENNPDMKGKNIVFLNTGGIFNF
jgi:1-aminocyclopropane-1-carboxylate deaminase/D-cysteine desulfhydrase-like pyridoxal-dependent ACC family enzyme